MCLRSYEDCQFFEKITEKLFLRRRKIRLKQRFNESLGGKNIFRFEEIRILLLQNLSEFYFLNSIYSIFVKLTYVLIHEFCYFV